jgi:enoyl-CoA hydratase
MEVILTGEPLPAERAHALGLVNRLCEPGHAEESAMALAAQVCACAPIAVWESRKVVLAAHTNTDDVLISMTNEGFGRVLQSEDTKEGLSAFIEKRPPNWQGR